jgi:hypothetical protein
LKTFRGFEALLINVSLFPKIRGLFKTIAEKLRPIPVMLGIWNNFEAFLKTFPEKWRLLIINVRLL